MFCYLFVTKRKPIIIVTIKITILFFFALKSSTNISAHAGAYNVNWPLQLKRRLSIHARAPHVRQLRRLPRHHSKFKPVLDAYTPPATTPSIPYSVEPPADENIIAFIYVFDRQISSAGNPLYSIHTFIKVPAKPTCSIYEFN